MLNEGGGPLLYQVREALTSGLRNLLIFLNRSVRGKSKQSEILVWIAASLTPFLNRDSIIALANLNIPDARLALLSPAISCCAILFFPFLIRQVFDDFPLALLRKMLPRSVGERGFNISNSPGVEIHIDAGTLRRGLFEQVDEAILDQNVATGEIKDPRKLLASFSRQSESLADRIYQRAGVYLLVGVIISLGGLGFFYIRTASASYAGGDLMEHALSLLPGFGVLFFIEFVALFFLRQHRAAMDDFRYFDAVRRHRQENLVLLAMFSENAKIVDTVDVIKAMTFYSGNQKLMKDETTETIEYRKIQGDDMVVFEKLIEAFSVLKSVGESSKKK